MKTLCHNIAALDVALYQTGFSRFTVTYGRQIKAGMTYSEAAMEYGRCIFHALVCNGHLDKRWRSEAREANDTTPYISAPWVGRAK